MIDPIDVTDDLFIEQLEISADSTIIQKENLINKQQNPLIIQEGKYDSSLNLENGLESQKISPESNLIAHKSEKTKNLLKNVVLGILVIIIIILVWFSVKDNQANKVVDDGSLKNVNIKVDTRKEEGRVNIVRSTGTLVAGKSLANSESFSDKIKIIGYYGNSVYSKEVKDCSLVYSLERFVENKYNSNLTDAVNGMLQPLSDEEKRRWILFKHTVRIHI